MVCAAPSEYEVPDTDRWRKKRVSSRSGRCCSSMSHCVRVVFVSIDRQDDDFNARLTTEAGRNDDVGDMQSFVILAVEQ